MQIMQFVWHKDLLFRSVAYEFPFYLQAAFVRECEDSMAGHAKAFLKVVGDL